MSPTRGLDKTQYSGHGVCTNFSASFRNMMFQDTTLGIDKLKQDRHLAHVIRNEQKKEKFQKLKVELEQKQTMNNYYFQNFGVRCPDADVRVISLDQLEVTLQRKLYMRNIKVSVIRIQTHWRMFYARKKYVTFISSRNKAIKTIQNWWRSYKKRQVIPELIKKTRFLAAQKIQKYLRGYIGYNEYMREKSKT